MVALEDRHRAYREAIADAIGSVRMHLTVAAIDPEGLADEMARLGPFLVICDRPYASDHDDVPAWIELSPEPNLSTKIYLYGQRRELINPTLEDLIEVVDEAERLASKGEAEQSR